MANYFLALIIALATFAFATPPLGRADDSGPDNAQIPSRFDQTCVDIGEDVIGMYLSESQLEFYQRDLSAIPYSQIYQTFYSAIDDYNPFILFNARKPEFARVLMDKMLDYVSWPLIRQSKIPAEVEDRRDSLRKYLQEQLPLPAPALTETDFWGMPVASLPREDITGIEVVTRALCYSALGFFDCPQAFHQALELNNPHIDYNTGYVSSPDLFTQIFINPLYYRPLIKTAILQLHKIQLAEAGLQVEGNVFDDLYQQFLLEGHSKQESADLTFDVLGAYGVRAAAITYARWISYKNAPVYTAFSILSGAMTYLDKYPHKDHRLYSLPKEVKTTCVYGKAYHFWLAAWVARHSALENNDKSALLSAHLLGQLYELFATFNGRNSYKVFDHELFHPLVNLARIDNVMQGIGASFAVHYHTPKNKLTYNADAILHFNFSQAQSTTYHPRKDLGRMNPDEFQEYFINWTKVLAPNSHLWMLP